MEFSVSKKNFLRGLARTHAVADRKSSMPILSNILLKAEGSDSLGLVATDLYLGVQARCPAEVKKGGSIAVSARTLFDIVKNLPDGEIHWTVGENQASEIRCGKVRYKIPGMDGKEFPTLPSPGDAKFMEVDVELLSELIGLTQYCMSTDDTRPHLSGALFEGEAKVLRMVTTDGHRLSKAESKLGQDAKMMGFSILVPSKGIGELKRLIEDAKSSKPKGEADAGKVGIATTGGNAFFKRDDIQLSVKLADEQFPPYSKVIPQSQQRRVVVGRVPLTESLKRISLVASDKSGGVRMQIEPGTMKITSENPDVGEGSEEVDVDFAGDELVVGFNARYMLDVLGALNEDEIALELGGELDPCAIRPVGDTDFVGVIMPMRI